MAFNFAKAKANLRRVVHETLAVDALYQDASMSDPLPIRVRWHTKIDRFGDLAGAGYAEVIEGVHRIILSKESARLMGVKRTGIITIPDYAGARLQLEEREPEDGPYEEIWQVSHP